MPWHNAFRDWLSKELVTRQGWIGVDLNGGGELKVLDYAAGTGVFSQVRSPGGGGGCISRDLCADPHSAGSGTVL